jgi:MFS family permease
MTSQTLGSVSVSATTVMQEPIRTTIPARLDRLRWSPFHTRLVAGLGTAWILDGLEITFFASAGASAAYLTVSEILPIEVRAQAISVFFALAQVAGAIGPALYGSLIGNGEDRTALMWGYLLGAAIMIAGGLVEVVFGVNAERRPLESVARPLTAVDA